jgi:PAS domain S-box-containing protein
METKNNMEESERTRMALLSLLEDQKETLDKLKESEEKYKQLSLLKKAILESPSGIIVFALDRNYCYLDFTLIHKLTMKQIWGVEIEVGMNMLDCILNPDDREKAKKNFDRALAGENFILIEEYGDEKLKRTFYEDRYSPILDEQNKIIGVSVFVTDITERMLAKETIEYERNLNRTILNLLPAAIWVKDKEGRKIFVNKAELELSGKNSEDEIIGKTDFELYNETDALKFTEEDKFVIEKGKSILNIEDKITKPDGNDIYLLGAKVPLRNSKNEIIGIVGVNNDITERKLNELQNIEKQKRTELQQKILIETATSAFIQSGDIENLSKEITEKTSKAFDIERVSVWIFSKNEKFLECVDLFEKTKNIHSSGYLLDENHFKNEFDALKSSKYVDANDPLTDSRTLGYRTNYLIPLNITAMLDGVINYSGKNYGTLCLEHVNKQHTWTEDEINFVSQLADQVAICLANKDRKLAEEKLIESEKRYRLIAENSMNVVTVLDFNFKFTYVSPSVIKLLGYTPEELLKTEVKNLIPQETFIKFQELFEEEFELEKSGNASPLRSRTIIAQEFHKDGYPVWSEITATFFRDDNGNPIGILASTKDITERKKIEDELKEREEQFHSLFENTMLGIYKTTPDGKIILANKALVKMLGFNSFEEMTKRNLNHEGFEPSYNREEFINLFSNENSITGLESKWTKKNGEVIYIRENVRAIRDSNNEILYFEGTAEDITEKKINEELLKQSEEKMRLIVEGTSYFFFYTHDMEGKITYISPSVELITGHKVEEWINQKHWFVTDSPLNKHAQKRTRKMLKGEIEKNPFFLEIFNANKEKILLELYEAPIYRNNKIIGLQGIAHDVTETNRLYEKIKILSSAIEQSPASVIITDVEGNINYVNPKFCEITGYTFDEVYGKKPNVLKSGLQSNEFYSQLWKTILAGKTWTGEFQNKKKNGELFWENVLISPITDDNGNITGFVAVKEDITEKKKTADQLIQSEEEFRSVWENSVDAMRLIDEDGIIINVNDAYCEMFYVTKDNLLGKPFNVSYIITEEYKSLDHYKEKFKLRTIPRKFETQIVLHSNDKIWVELTNSFIDIGKEKPMLLTIFRNITEQKKMIEDLTEARKKAEASDKLKSEFLAQISHEIRSPLNVIVNFNSLLKIDYDNLTPEERTDIFNGISNSSQRIIRTIDLILNSSEMQLGSYNPIFAKINVYEKIVEKAFHEFRHLAESRNLVLKLKKLTDKVSVKCDEYSFYQSVVNIIDNAIKYTKKGSIEIKLQRNEKKKLQIEIADTGIGMSEEYLNRLFTPFSQEETGYTRKFEGTGLGLSLVKKYCDLNNIAIDVKSKKGEGSTFTLTFENS